MEGEWLKHFPDVVFLAFTSNETPEYALAFLFIRANGERSERRDVIACMRSGERSGHFMAIVV